VLDEAARCGGETSLLTLTRDRQLLLGRLDTVAHGVSEHAVDEVADDLNLPGADSSAAMTLEVRFMVAPKNRLRRARCANEPSSPSVSTLTAAERTGAATKRLAFAEMMPRLAAGDDGGRAVNLWLIASPVSSYLLSSAAR
jgi:hypothetical protein